MKERGAKPALRRLSVPQKPHRRPPLWRRCVRYIVLGMWISAVATYLWAIRDIEQSHGQRANGAYVDATDPSQAWWASPNVTLARRFMLVVAHPDDECLFFSPTLLSMLRPRRRPLTVEETASRNDTLARSAPLGHVLSLSSGNAEGLGNVRGREMRASCWALGIPSPRCISLDHPALPDSMRVWWPEQAIEELVQVYIEKWGIDLIITFDHYGVSGHANHRAIAAAMSRAVHKNATFPPTLMLRSAPLIQKYSSLLSLPYALYVHDRDRQIPLPPVPRPSLVATPSLGLSASSSSATSAAPSASAAPANLTLPPWTFRNHSHPLSTHRSFFLSTPRQYIEGRRAFAQHKSQGRWFRRLWLLTSRYMWWNELEKVVPISSRTV